MFGLFLFVCLFVFFCMAFYGVWYYFFFSVMVLCVWYFEDVCVFLLWWLV